MAFDMFIIRIMGCASTHWLKIKNAIVGKRRSPNECSSDDSFSNVCVCSEHLVDSKVFVKMAHFMASAM
jgi:hypothetical protein